MHRLLLPLILAIGTGNSPAEQPFIEYQPGTLPLVLAAPHGGTLKPVDLPNRNFGRVAQDTNTAEIVLALAATLEAKTGQRPHVILCRLHRTKVDCNREIKEAAQGDPAAEAAWHEFHDACATACEAVTQLRGCGLFLDVHGHRHEEPRVELGYLLTANQLAMSNTALDQETTAIEQSSIRELVARSGRNLSALMYGPNSLGSLLEARSILCVPSPTKPAPTPGADYFSGAYDIQAHGSRDGGTVSAIQVECPWKGVRDTADNQRAFVAAMAESLLQYFPAVFKMPLATQKRQK
ncbi:MAG: hypothetical protein KDK97_00025 [Verrucomicrobiales bacterium]|nr:hypothetical protein [Verrucomicrobiales bacterium]MCP5559951.1 hypothetical protein [Verrucomicrobiaceae bacterium]